MGRLERKIPSVIEAVTPSVRFPPASSQCLVRFEGKSPNLGQREGGKIWVMSEFLDCIGVRFPGSPVRVMVES